MRSSRSLYIRLLSLTLCLVGVLCFLRPAEASEAEQTATTLTSIVRNGASYSAAPIGQLENGTAVTVLEQIGDFYRIDCYDTDGYIACQQVSGRKNAGYYVNCQTDFSETRTFTYQEHDTALQLRHSLYALAREQLGKPYIYGSTGPRGFDCSGLMLYLFDAHGIALHRRASEQLQDGIIVSSDAMQVGDLVFFHESWDSCPASHVGIYVGDGQIIHAGSGGMEYAALDYGYYAANFLCVRRVVDTDRAQLEQVTTSVTVTTANARRIR